MTTQPELVRLRSPGGAKATVFPGMGMNCIALDLMVGDRSISVLHAEPDVLSGGVPTRSGMPVLFPFPSNIAGACFDWRGESVVLPIARPGASHASHGLACRTPWAQYTVSPDGRAVTGRFESNRDVPDSVAAWPGNLSLVLTYSLSDNALRVASTVTNTGDIDSPFGLGFHSYFTPLGEPGGPDALSECSVECRADSAWVLESGIPDGQRVPVSSGNDLRSETAIGDMVLDDVLTDLPPFVADTDGLMLRATLSKDRVRLALRCDESWREIVVFTPANRESIAIEPYTCPTDAVHLDQRGLDVGWRVLEPGGTWTGVFELRIDAD
jgi:aldose 1-epimerase